MNGGHAPAVLLARYATGVELPADAVWALEAHLEGCADCRSRLGEIVYTHSPAVVSIVDNVWAAVAPAVHAQVPPRRRWWPALLRWAAPAALPWLAMTVLLPVTAMLLDLAAGVAGPPRPSVLLVIAPVVPMLGVAASWTRYLDPVHDLVASTPRAGLGLALRRTLAALIVVMPPLALAGAVVGAAPVRWLLPSLVFAASALALGAFVGVGRAAAAVTVGWVGAVVAPSLLWSRLPAALDPAISTPAWAACAVIAAAALFLQRGAFQRPASHR
ncbi:zf-HC2 domain-containing protein [Catellatospora citrea]|uniref:zf-HC2 domain-containing protein n=1 Tax=Catellatospora citrea TaxID=53366 RepID=UPI0033F07C79